MKDEERDYDVYRTDFKYLRIVFRVFIFLVIIILLLFLLRGCEKPSDDSGCWECFVKTSISYETEPHLREVYDHYISCDSLFQPRMFETMNTWDWDTINGIRMKRETTCKPLECAN
jgi:hypothetical protein